MAIIWFGIFLCVGDRHRAAARRRWASATPWPWPRPTAGCAIMDPSPSLTAPYTLWSGLIGGLFLMLSYFGCDQSQVQRYLSGQQPHPEPALPALQRVPQGADAVPDPAHRRAGVRLLPLPARRRCSGTRSSCGGWRRRPPPAELAALRGALRGRARRAPRGGRAFAATADARAATPSASAYRRAHAQLDARRARRRCARSRSASGGTQYNDTNYIFPSYILAHLPSGLAGLVIAVIFAAAMSTLSGEFNSLATATHGRLLQALRAPRRRRRATTS